MPDSPIRATPGHNEPAQTSSLTNWAYASGLSIAALAAFNAAYHWVSPPTVTRAEPETAFRMTLLLGVAASVLLANIAGLAAARRWPTLHGKERLWTFGLGGVAVGMPLGILLASQDRMSTAGLQLVAAYLGVGAAALVGGVMGAARGLAEDVHPGRSAGTRTEAVSAIWLWVGLIASILISPCLFIAGVVVAFHVLPPLIVSQDIGFGIALAVGVLASLVYGGSAGLLGVGWAPLRNEDRYSRVLALVVAILAAPCTMLLGVLGAAALSLTSESSSWRVYLVQRSGALAAGLLLVLLGGWLCGAASRRLAHWRHRQPSNG